MSRKNLLSIVSSIAVVSVILAACGSKETSTSASPASAASGKEVTLTIGAAPVPHSEILNFIKPKLKEQGVNLVIKTFDDEAPINPALKDKQLDANWFQHVPYLDSIKKEKGYDFAVVAAVHVEPIGFYSSRLKSKEDLKEGAKIGIPNNSANEYRALVLLQQQGLIKLKDGLTTYQATPKDIIDNPKKLQFIEADAATLPRSLPDLDGAVINTSHILDAKLDPKSALFREDAKSPYANVVVVRKGDENRDEVKKLRDALLTPEVKKFIQDKYGVAVVPAF